MPGVRRSGSRELTLRTLPRSGCPFLCECGTARRRGPRRPSIYFPVLEDSAVIGTSASAKAGETVDRTIARLESFVAETIAPTLRDDDRAAARQVFALPLGTTQIPDFALAQNPYAVALALGRRAARD